MVCCLVARTAGACPVFRGVGWKVLSEATIWIIVVTNRASLVYSFPHVLKFF